MKIIYNEFHREKVFKPRGIALEIAEARPYLEWSAAEEQARSRKHKSDPQRLGGPVREHFDYTTLDKSQKSHLSRIVNQCDGLVMVRHAPERVSDVPERPVKGRAPFPELRPDRVVRNKPAGKPHFHGDRDSIPSLVCAADADEFVLEDRREGIKRYVPGGYVWDRAVHDGRGLWVKLKGYPDWVREVEFDAEKDFAPNPDKYGDHPDRFPDFIDGVRCYYGGHGGVNTDEPHRHISAIKYCFLNAAKVEEEHRHSDEYKGKPYTWKRDHLRRKHRVPCPVQQRWGRLGGQCDHPVKIENPGDGTRHKHKVKDKNAVAKRLDVHPWAERLFDRAQVVFMIAEGIPKSDSVLAQGEAVFNIPAVWQFDVSEMPEFVGEYLAGKLVVATFDSDWADPTKGVTRAAYECREHLYRLGVEAILAAPPGGPDGDKAGVDDHLGAGGTLEELLVIDPGLPEEYVEFVLGEWRGRRGPAAEHNNVSVWRMLAIMANEHGKGRLRKRHLADTLGISEASVRRAVKRLERAGVLTTRATEKKVITYELDPDCRRKETEPHPLGGELNRRGLELTRHPKLRALLPQPAIEAV